MSYRVRLSDNALETIVLAAAEAYCLGDGHKRRHIEILGYMWGTTRRTREVTEVYIERASVSLSARRNRDWVEPNQHAPRLKNQIVQRWSPHLQLLGDFHTHTYGSLTDVDEIRGFEFSEDDFEFFREDDFLWENSETPLMLAVTVARLGAVRETIGATYVRRNVACFDVGELRLWLNAAVGYMDEGGRQHTGNTRSPLALDLGPRLFNSSGDRVFER